ncbi:MAG TPA: sporulation protein YjcZ [Mollicutes bacterium]|jgi:hypothetical protein|nr:sporulation protein YjcZ [Mollicutes bacterium]
MCPGFGCGYPVCGYPGYGSTFGGGGWIIAILIVIFVLFFICRPWYKTVC